MVKFHPDNHIYQNIDLFDKTEWVSASKLAGMFKPSFNAVEMADKVSTKRTSKWYGIAPQDILAIWKAENLRSTTLGTWYHEKQEQKLLAAETTTYNGKQLPIIQSVWEDGWKIAGEQKLSDGVYPEHLAYLKSACVCGQFDEIIVCDGVVDVLDFKTNKDLKKPPFTSWDGVVEKMTSPLLHIENCKLNEYCLQLSIGMYIVLRHNPLLKQGKMIVDYVTFEVEGENEYGYPIMRLDGNNEPIIKDVEKLELPYMKREVELMFDHIKKKRLQNV